MSTGAARLSGVKIEPDPSAWRAALGAPRGDERAKRFREQAGLPTDRPVVMTGHQAEWWHPGIAAKFMAAQEAAAAFGAAAASVVADQDSNNPGEVRVPVRRAAGGENALSRRTWRVLRVAGELAAGDVPTCRMPAETPAPMEAVDGAEPAAPFVAEGLARIEAVLARHAGESSAARQTNAGAAELLKEMVADTARSAPMVYASELWRTDLFGWFVERMRADPAACARAYNAAAAAVPRARIAPLHPAELPLWHIPSRPGSARVPVFAENLGRAPVSELAPRALLMTAMLRLAGSDLFIHGTGGAEYDRITERWMGAWLGEALSPSAVVTATLLLPLEGHGVTPREVARAQWMAHAARHDPALLGDRAAAEEKRRLVEQIRATKRAGRDPAPEFAAMQQTLVRARASHAVALAELDVAAAGARTRREEAAVLADRTWAFPLYPREDLLALGRAVAERFKEKE